MRHLLIFVLCCIAVTESLAQAPPEDTFRVLPSVTGEAPVITAYLKYQTEMAWEQDAQRRHAWENVHSEQELLKLQEQIRHHLLSMLGGLPSQRTPLHPQITGSIKMEAFHIETLIYLSLPKI